MPHLITLSRAARLVGVKRGALQKKIREGKLRTFEGEILLTDLLHCYPQTEVEDTSMLERVEQIKEQAVNKVIRSVDHAPDSGALAARVMALSQELATARHEARHLAGVINGLQAQFDLLESGDSLPDDAFSTLRQWLTNALASEDDDELKSDEIFARETFLRVMEAQIRILPSGHEFLIEGSDSILEAGLRNGHALAYGCSNGKCGKCKAKLVSGQIKKISHHEYVLTEAEKGLGYFLTCSNTAVTDVVIEAEEAAGSMDIPLQDIDVRIRKIERPDDRVIILETRTPRTNRLRFLAGQYLMLKIGDLPASDCSITSCPCDGMNLQFQIPLVAGDPLSEHLATSARAHDVISISGPRGDFVLNEESPRSLLFIAGNAGIGAIKSLIEQAMALDVAEDIHLAWIVTHGNSHYLDNLCRSWDDALDNFHYTALQADDEQSVPGLLQEIIGMLGSLDQYDCYVCMPYRMLGPARDFLTASGAPENQVHVELLR
jgi:CDP-4-dehydro-6-deoxyglucose reductase